MKKNVLSAVALLIVSATLTTASAQTRTPHIRHRQVNQQKRIGQGVSDGQLTPREAEHLEAREAKIQHDKREAKADGKVTAAERRKLNREENRTSRAIYRQKHDAQTTK